jgi:hypothetical protein
MIERKSALLSTGNARTLPFKISGTFAFAELQIDVFALASLHAAVCRENSHQHSLPKLLKIHASPFAVKVKIVRKQTPHPRRLPGMPHAALARDLAGWVRLVTCLEYTTI